MTTLAQVRDGLEARIDSINGLRVYDYVPDDVAGFPAATIDLVEIEYSGLDLGAARRVVFAIGLFVPRTVDRMQLRLYDFIDNGPGSIMAAVQADPKLDGLNVNARVLSGSVALDTQQLGLGHLYGRTVNVNVFVD